MSIFGLEGNKCGEGRELKKLVLKKLKIPVLLKEPRANPINLILINKIK
jgi:hypothetical protein